jgi:hypothetical protein
MSKKRDSSRKNASVQEFDWVSRLQTSFTREVMTNLDLILNDFADSLLNSGYRADGLGYHLYH